MLKFYLVIFRLQSREHSDPALQRVIHFFFPPRISASSSLSSLFIAHRPTSSVQLSPLERISHFPRSQTKLPASPLQISRPRTVAAFFCCQLCAKFFPSSNHIGILQCVRSSYIRWISSRLSPVTPVTRLVVITVAIHTIYSRKRAIIGTENRRNLRPLNSDLGRFKDLIGVIDKV